MRLLLYSWNANNESVLSDHLKREGFELVVYDKPCRHYTRDLELAADMIPFIHAQKAEAVISFNYFPILSMICNTCRIPYYAWVYDCPHYTLYAGQIMLPCNHIGVFDREMARHLREDYQAPTVFYAPLAADAHYFDRVIRGERNMSGLGGKQRLCEIFLERYRCDVSFVGSLYTGEHDYYDSLLGEEEKRALDPLIGRQCFCYEKDHISEALAQGIIDLDGIRRKMEKAGLMLGEDYFAAPEDILVSSVLDKKVTVEERRILLEKIAAAGYDLRLFTGSDTKGNARLDAVNQGPVDYHTQMPLVFAHSRVNLNISLRSIRSGIPLRVLDIMACGGFVLSNRQPELEEYFTDGAELALFRSLEECMDKLAYYLAHEERRREIAAAGKRRTEELFSYDKGLERMFTDR